MATLKILEFPNPNLRKIAVPVTSFDNDLKCLIDNMFETMYEANGIGLAATQVDVHKRLLVLDVSEERNDPKVFVNPTIDVIESDLADYDEGCLSVPGFYETVSRPWISCSRYGNVAVSSYWDLWSRFSSYGRLPRRRRLPNKC